MWTRKHVFLCKFREIWPTGSRWNRALFNGQNKYEISARAPAAASERIAPKICQGQLRTMYSEFPKFHANPFTSGGVIAKRVNIVQTRHKVFAILGEASASSPSNEQIHNIDFICSYWHCQWSEKRTKLEIWANAQRDGRPAEYRWRHLFNAAKFLWRPLLECRAVTLPRRETRWH